MSEFVEQLERMVDQLCGLDVDTLTDAELSDAVIAVQHQRDRLGVAAARLLDRWQHRGVWALDGSRSAAARLSRDTHTSTATAHGELRRARALSMMPATVAAIHDGDVSLDGADLLARANTISRRDLFTDHEADLVDTLRGLRYRDARRVVAYWCQRADAELDRDDGTAERQRDANSVSAVTTLDGTVLVSGVLDPISGAIVSNQLDRISDELRLTDMRDGVVRTPTQRRAAALVEMARRSATAPADGRTPRPLFTALVGDRALGQLCELANGTVVSPAHLAPFVDTALLESVLFDGPSTVVSVTRKRSFTGAVRRAIEVRDRHCQHPSGCDEPADRCDVDHIIPHADGGPTSQFNGRLECPTHNRNPDKHDHDATPQPERPITRLDELRARIRWKYYRDLPDDTDDDADEHFRDPGELATAN